ncbi:MULTISPECIES: type II secretion system F family protein [unclassified Streptomyces]|uniref:type II secretion system F family protein n=1 Tax=unclassified Streptomyces TaxID=2593676 RepID=UPI000CD5979B|nr:MULTISPECIES: type II secretion system F family protein [unclassified Streptomyces]AWL42803.1 type II secretion protein F [Streptomyces sp. SM18]
MPLSSLVLAAGAGLTGGLAVARDPGPGRARAMFADHVAREPGVLGAWAVVRARLDGHREWLCVPVAVLLAVLGESVLPLLAGALALPLTRRWIRRRALRRSRERAADAVTALCADLVGELRAGREPGQALLLVGRGQGALGTAEAAVLAAARFGGDVPGALRKASAAPGLEGLAGMAACWKVAVDGGAGLATGLARIEHAFRAERRGREELRAQLAGAWSTVVVLALLPMVGLGLGAAMGADPLRVLLHTPGGLACLVAGSLTEGAGLFWAARIVRTGETV